MTGEPVQGYVLHLYNKYLDIQWPGWAEFKAMIAARFTPHSLPQVALKKLQGMTQEGWLIDEFITDFLNFKLEAQILNGFAQHILL